MNGKSKPFGISIEIGHDRRGWFLYIGRYKLLHIRPTRHKNDGGKKFIFDYYKQGKYNHRDWKPAAFGGLKIDLGFGKWRRPIPKFWKKAFWPGLVAWWRKGKISFEEKYMIKEPATNAWNSANHDCVLFWRYFPILPFFFISFCCGKGEKTPGFWFGLRSYLVNKTSQAIGLYDIGDPWVRLYKAEYPKYTAWGSPKEEGNIYLYPWVQIKKDLVD